jgi:hypothetical protein
MDENLNEKERKAIENWRHCGDYTHIDRLCKGAISLQHWSHGRQVWTLAFMRKKHVCRVCKQEIVSGAKAYRPITNSDNRYHRICPECIAACQKD